MWKILAKSMQGTSHRRENIPCQDSCRTSVLHVANEKVLVLTASDGAGSAPHADVGSRIACESLQRIVTEDLERWGGLRCIAFEDSARWYQLTLADLQSYADHSEFQINDLACTLLVAVVGETGAAFCQIGDGAMVTQIEDQVREVFWPQSGEYVNTTNFITAGRIPDDLMFEWRNVRIDRLAVFTDGLQTVALDFAERSAHEPFFSPIFRAMGSCADASELEIPLKDFLESPTLADRTDDDLTLILASRITSHEGLL